MRINYFIFIFIGLIVVFATARELKNESEQVVVHQLSPQDDGLNNQKNRPSRPDQVPIPNQVPIRPGQGSNRPNHGPNRPNRPSTSQPGRPQNRPGTNQQGVPFSAGWQNQQWTGQHWNQNPWNGFYFPTEPPQSFNLERNWDLPDQFMQKGQFNPWGPQFQGSNRRRYNYADRYAYEYFRRNGYTVYSSLVFCNNPYINYIVRSSKSLRRFCRFINRNYWFGSVPVFPKSS